MAAATVASTSTHVFGDKRVVLAKLTAPADADTWNTGLLEVENVQVTIVGGTIAAGDHAGVTSVSGGTITFEIVGTARDIFVLAVGI